MSFTYARNGSQPNCFSIRDTTPRTFVYSYWRVEGVNCLCVLLDIFLRDVVNTGLHDSEEYNFCKAARLVTIADLKPLPINLTSNSQNFWLFFYRMSPFFKLYFLSQHLWSSHPDTPHSVGLLWTSDQPVAETAKWQQSIRWKRHPRPAAGFEPAIPASELPQIHA